MFISNFTITDQAEIHLYLCGSWGLNLYFQSALPWDITHFFWSLSDSKILSWNLETCYEIQEEFKLYWNVQCQCKDILLSFFFL